MNVSILGSCVSRDAFEMYGSNYEIKEYFARTSLISLAKPSINITNEELENKSEFRKKCVYNDLNKSLYTHLNSFEGEYLVIDFIDERFDIIKIENTLATYSNELVESNYLVNKRYERISRLKIDNEIWKESADLFISRVSERYTNKQIILHRALLSDRYTDGDNIFEYDDLNRKRNEEINKLLIDYYDYIISNIPGINIIDIEERIANKNHKWGLSACHFTDKYYEEFIEKMGEIIKFDGINKEEKTYTTSKPIRFVFEKSKIINKNKLIVVFSSINSSLRPSYDYVKRLKKYDCNKLFIVDDYNYYGTYYMNNGKQKDIESSIMSLISNIMAENNILYKNVIILGSKRGGSAALYYGTKYNFGTVIAKRFQYRIGSYINNLHNDSLIKSILGEKNEKNIIMYDNYLRKIMYNYGNTQYYLVVTQDDIDNNKYSNELFKDMDNQKIKYVKCILDKDEEVVDSNHKYFFDEILEDKLEKLYRVSVDSINKTIQVELLYQENVETAFYLVRNGEKLRSVKYGMHKNIIFDIKETGIYRVDIFFSLENERFGVSSDYIEINIDELMLNLRG